MSSSIADKYRQFCAEHEKVPVFLQPWYLDIVTHGLWDVVLTYAKDGEVSGVWPYVMKKKRGFSMIQMPFYTFFLGPVVFVPAHTNSVYKRTSFYAGVIRKLESQLPDASYLNIKFPVNGESWFPLYELGYKQTTRYTYIIDHKRGKEHIQANLKPQLRNTIRNKFVDGGDSKKISVSLEVDAFIEIVGQTLKGNNVGEFFDPALMRLLISTAIAKGQGTVYSYDAMSAGIFVLRDHEKCYCLFTATSEQGKAEEGVACLIWRAVLDAVELGLDFDFEGSMLPGVEKFFRSFGGEQRPYHEITKINSPLLRWYTFLKPKR